jgi:hypothetical protein
VNRYPKLAHNQASSPSLAYFAAYARMESIPRFVGADLSHELAVAKDFHGFKRNSVDTFSGD